MLQGCSHWKNICIPGFAVSINPPFIQCTSCDYCLFKLGVDGQQAALLALIDLYCLDRPLLGLFPTASVHGFRNSSSARGLHPIPESCCGYIFFSPVFGFISCCSCLDPLRGPQDWFVTSLLEKPAASSLLCLPHLGAVGLLPGWWGYCSACAVVTLGPWLLFFSNTWPPVKKTAAGRAGKLKVLYYHISPGQDWCRACSAAQRSLFLWLWGLEAPVTLVASCVRHCLWRVSGNPIKLACLKSQCGCLGCGEGNRGATYQCCKESGTSCGKGRNKSSVCQGPCAFPQ